MAQRSFAYNDSDKRSYTRINRGGYSEGDAIWISFLETFFRKAVGSGHMDWRARLGTASAFARETPAQHSKHTALKPQRGGFGRGWYGLGSGCEDESQPFFLHS